MSASYVLAQDPAPAPIPTQIIPGKKAFISNASGVSVVATGVPEQTYNEFYAAMKSWGRYKLVAAPGDADVVFELRLVFLVGGVSVMNGNGSSSGSEQLRVTILDPKTHIVLWEFTESIQRANRQATGRKNFDAALANLVNDVRNLVGQPAAAGAGTQK